MTTKHERPLLYVLATQPSTPDHASTSEWIIELFKPPPTGLKPLATVSQPKHSSSSSGKHHHHHFLPTFGLSHKTGHQPNKTAGSIPPTALSSPSASQPTVPVSAPVPASVQAASTNTATTLSPTPLPVPASAPVSEPERVFFSRIHQGSSSTPLPTSSSSLNDSSSTTTTPIILRMAVTSIPYQHSHQITSDLDAECTSALETVHTTPDSASWLRQALLALQGKGILPPVSHDFDVTKFLSLAHECLEKTLEKGRTVAQQQPREVRYARLLRGLENDGDDSVDADDGDLNVGEEDDVGQARDWSLPHRERKSVAEKGAGSDVGAISAGAAGSKGGGGGFWISHGPLAERTRTGKASVDVDRKPWERGNVYGGLL